MSHAEPAFQTALAATIRRLESEARRGRRWVTIDKTKLGALEQRPDRAKTPPATETTTPARRSEKTPNLRPKASVSPPALVASAAPAADLSQLRETALACARCAHLARSRRNVVFGVGNESADLMFVGEAPGMDEDAQAEPFVGKAGQLLTKIIQTMGLSRDEVYIANILKCRPDTPKQRFGNRPPTSDEMAECLPYLLRQIELIQPKVLVALGATALVGLFGKQREGITAARGKWREYRGIPLMPTFHPSYLLRRNTPEEKRKVWVDMLAVMERLEMPITEKQRGYFGH